MWHEMNGLFTKYMKYGSMNSIFRVFNQLFKHQHLQHKQHQRYIIKYRAKTTEEMSTTKHKKIKLPNEEGK